MVVIIYYIQPITFDTYKVSVVLNNSPIFSGTSSFCQDVYDERTGIEIIRNLKNNVSFANGIDFSHEQTSVEFYIKRSPYKNYANIVDDIKLITNNCMEIPSAFKILKHAS